jgi:hypothetical protein
LNLQFTLIAKDGALGVGEVFVAAVRAGQDFGVLLALTRQSC